MSGKTYEFVEKRFAGVNLSPSLVILIRQLAEKDLGISKLREGSAFLPCQWLARFSGASGSSA